MGEGGAPAAGMRASGAVVGCLGGDGEVVAGESLRLFTDECLRWRRPLGEARGRREGERCGDREDWRIRGRSWLDGRKLMVSTLNLPFLESQHLVNVTLAPA